MNFDYAQSAQDALDLLIEFDAQPCMVTVLAPAPEVDDYDPTSGTGAALPPVVLVLLGVVLDFPLKAKSNGVQADSLVRAGDRYVILAAIDVNGLQVLPEQLPIEAELLAPDGLTYVVRDVNPLNPTGYPVLYELTVRR